MNMREFCWNTVVAIGMVILLSVSIIPVPASAILTTQSVTQISETNKLDSHEVQFSTASTDIVEHVIWQSVSDEDGTIRLKYSYDLPPSAKNLEVRFIKQHNKGYQGVTPINTHNLDNTTHSGEKYYSYEWDQSQHQDDPEIIIKMSVPNGVYDSSKGGIKGDGWALATEPYNDVSWTYSGNEIELKKEQSVAVEGYASGNGYVFIGEHEVYEAESEDENIKLVVPKVADPASSPQTILSNLIRASNTLNIGAESDTVTAFVFPGHKKKPVAGQATADSFFVGGNLDISSSVWYHEYVHTRQDFGTEKDTRWLREASADYFGHVLQLNLGHIEYGKFHSQMYETRSTGTLSEPETWTVIRGYSLSDYEKGRQALAATNQKLRKSSDGDTTISDVFRRLNSRGDVVSNKEFISVVDTHTVVFSLEH